MDLRYVLEVQEDRCLLKRNMGVTRARCNRSISGRRSITCTYEELAVARCINAAV